MAYALGFPKDVTDRIMDMRDCGWEMVRDGGKTPSASCLNCISGNLWKTKGLRMHYVAWYDEQCRDALAGLIDSPTPYVENLSHAGIWGQMVAFRFKEFETKNSRRVRDMSRQCESCAFR